MAVKGSWSYNSATGSQTNLDVPGPQFADYGVLKAKKGFPKADPTLDWLAVQKGAASLPDGASFDRSSDFLYFRLDNLFLYFYSNTLKQTRPDKYIFTDEDSGLNFKIDFRHDIFSAKLTNEIIPWVTTPGDGLDAYLGVPGKANGGVHLGLQGKTKLQYTPPATSN